MNKESKFVLSEQDTINNIKKTKRYLILMKRFLFLTKSRAMNDASEDDYPIDSLVIYLII